MIGQSVTHLLPSSQAVAVSAKQPQVPFVGLPVLQAIVPVSYALSFFELLARINVVNVKHAIISVSTLGTSPTKRVHDSNFARPVAWLFMLLKAMLVPVVFATLHRTKAVFAHLAAPFAALFSFPSRPKVAGACAIFSRAIFNPVLMRLEGLLAIAAKHCNRCLFHGRNIAESTYKSNFEDAQKQGDLFVELAPPKPEQSGLDLGGAA